MLFTIKLSYRTEIFTTRKAGAVGDIKSIISPIINTHFSRQRSG